MAEFNRIRQNIRIYDFSISTNQGRSRATNSAAIPTPPHSEKAGSYCPEAILLLLEKP